MLAVLLFNQKVWIFSLFLDKTYAEVLLMSIHNSRVERKTMVTQTYF